MEGSNSISIQAENDCDDTYAVVKITREVEEEEEEDAFSDSNSLSLPSVSDEDNDGNNETEDRVENARRTLRLSTMDEHARMSIISQRNSIYRQSNYSIHLFVKRT